MALIICTECGKEFSDKAAACPNCGCPTSEVLLCIAKLSKDDSVDKAPENTSSEFESEKMVYFIQQSYYEWEVFNDRIDSYILKSRKIRTMKMTYLFEKISSITMDRFGIVYIHMIGGEKTQFYTLKESRDKISEICDYVNSRMKLV